MNPAHLGGVFCDGDADVDFDFAEVDPDRAG
ncbi:MAG: hypothetical protein QOH27_6031 [Mycobacterium sp.]|nr:hypothetical protein [Mycobacterium sp.]